MFKLNLDGFELPLTDYQAKQLVNNHRVQNLMVEPMIFGKPLNYQDLDAKQQNLVKYWLVPA